jgi:two-component system sensor histidine kinase UhpB
LALDGRAVYGTFSRNSPAIGAKIAGHRIEASMSLKTRLALSIVAAFIAALALGGVLAIWRADNSVRAEMAAALDGGKDIVTQYRASRPAGSDIAHLVHSFDGERHLKAAAVDTAGRTVAVSAPAAVIGEAPRWFEHLIAPKAGLYRASYANWTFVLTTDARNEVAEVWGQTRDGLFALMAFCLAVSVAIYFLIVRELNFLATFAGALDQVSNGKYDVELASQGPPEFSRLARGYNAMTARLKEFTQRNVQLQQQIVDVEEQERAEIARDLHDEVGPFLFSIKVDADAIPALIAANDARALSEHADRIRDATDHIQKHVRSILRQLKTVDILDFGIEAAIGDIIAFWSARNENIRFSVDVTLEDTLLGRRESEVIYRLVQESVSNAIRHAKPGSISVSIASTTGKEILLSVTDDGTGIPTATPNGRGLIGMAERARSLGGRLSIAKSASGVGTQIVATLPVGAPQQADASQT